MNLPTPEKPHAPSCVRNRDVILDRLRIHFADCTAVLEIGSGTGQHAVHFAAALPHLRWQCSDRDDMLPGIRMWLADAALPNTPPPLPLDVSRFWPDAWYDAVFSANTLHIMAWQEVVALFAALPAALSPGGTLIIYGPFNYGGRFTSDSNAEFDRSLKAREPHRGIRDFEAVDALAQEIGLQLIEDHEMPANNRCVVWRQARSAQ